jgi:hypothetical protein
MVDAMCRESGGGSELESKRIAAALVLVLSFASAHAQLTAVTRNGDRMVDDAALNVTWADVESPTLLIWSPTGVPESAQAWVASLNAAHGGRGYGGYNDWRLATGPGAPFSPVNPANELGSLFYTELGNPPSERVKNLGPFAALSSSRIYWSGSRFEPNPDFFSWGFNTGNGRQFRDNLFAKYAALAVRSGQVSGTH